jgi:phytanoyl-CoA dioxygenase PhyH
VLGQDEIDQFIADGFVAVRGAIPPAVIQACQDAIWAELAGHGLRREDPATWTEPVVRIVTPDSPPFVAAGSTRLVGEACDQLLGPGRWIRHPGVGGTTPVRFPSPADPGDAGWHIEASYADDSGPRVNVRSRGRGLLALYLFTDVGPDDAPTRIRPGSHLDVPPILAPAGQRDPDGGLDWPTAARRAVQASAHRPTVWATGQAGDVFLCHPFLVHAASWPHRGHSPRMMAQPPVLLTDGQFPPPSAPSLPPTPVERTMA